MRFTWISVLGISLLFTTNVIYGSSSNSEEPTENVDKENQDDFHKLIEELKKEPGERLDLPILPPLILLDFTNGTNSSTPEEKSKRTVDGDLGYGIQGNHLFSGHYKYYFPGGKGGTAVSIEESVSPVVPRTIFEIEKPITEKQEDTKPSNIRTFGFQGEDFQAQQKFPSNHQSVFGQRTKLFKSESESFGSNQKYSTPRPGFLPTTASPSYDGYLTPKPVSRENSFASVNYATPKPLYNEYTSSWTPSYGSSSKHNFQQKPAQSSTLKPLYGNDDFYRLPSSLSDYPKFTVENGVRYEHKIVWKYPDGKVSEDPPTSYVDSYEEYNPGSLKSSYSPNAGTYSAQTESSLHYQGPMQFPKDQETNNRKPQSQFVTPSQVSKNQRAPQNYDPVYLRNFGEKQNASPESSKTYQNFRQVSVPKYQVGGPNPEYTGSIKSASTSNQNANFFAPSRQLSPELLSKYKSQAQKYLSKVFSPGKESYESVDSSANDQYSNFLNGNPSISQYIKNPASILNAQPTFIQAGNSLIPVIVLRVDGTLPVQARKTTNLNLKALLQQYITQYASSMNDLTREANYDFGETEQLQSESRDPLFELKQLARNLKQYSEQSHKLSQDTARNKQQNSPRDSYGNILNPDTRKLLPQNDRDAYKRQQKVKSVQIIDDPRFKTSANGQNY